MEPTFEPADGDEAQEVFPTIVPFGEGCAVIFPFGVDQFARKVKCDVIAIGEEGELMVASAGDDEWRDFFDLGGKGGSVVSLVRN